MNVFFLALFMASIDVIVLSLLKMKYLNEITGNWVFVVAFLVYGCQSIIFYKSLQYSSLTQMNILWDVTSDLLVTIVGLYVFKEVITSTQKIGILFAIAAIFLLK